MIDSPFAYHKKRGGRNNDQARGDVETGARKIKEDNIIIFQMEYNCQAYLDMIRPYSGIWGLVAGRGLDIL